MADRKCTDLTALAAGSQATGDLLMIVDVSEGAATDKNKKITVESLFKGIPSNVGIGTSNLNTNTVLSVHKGDSSESQMRFTNSTTGEAGNNGFLVGIDSSEGGRLFVQENNYLRFGTNNTERLRIDSSGRLNIGTTTNAYTNARLQVNDSNGSFFVTQYAHLLLQNKNSSTTNWWNIAPRDNGQLTIGNGAPDANGIVSDKKVVINSSGNVGIATTSPSSKLHVNGTAKFDDYIHFGGVISTPQTAAAIYRPADNQLAFSTANSERMRIDSSGNVGIGTSSPTQKLSLENGTFKISGTSTFASNVEIGRVGGDNNLAFATGGTERMRIDSNGNVGIGHASPASLLTVGGDAITSAKPTVCVFPSSGNSSLTLRGGASTLSFDITGAGNNGTIIYDNNSHLLFKNGTLDSSTERMRIQSDGTVGIGFSNPSCKLDVKVATSSATSAVFRVRSDWQNTDQIQMQVMSNGNVQNRNNSYGAISDAKLKENIVDANSQWKDIKNIRVRNYNFIVNEGVPVATHIGVVAQEVETISPGLVTESPDLDDDGNDLGTVTKSVNYSVLYMKAVKALQEAQARIETLESQQADLLARVTALEAS